MAQTGVLAPRVVVRPPAVPAPPPISLLSQGNVVDDDADVIGSDGVERWSGGGGVTWLEPLRQWESAQIWQAWPDAAGDSQTDKRRDVNDNSVAALGLSQSDQSANQLPLVATAVLSVGALESWAQQQGLGQTTLDEQLARAFDAILPRLIEQELWSGAGADFAGWTHQFRLKGATVSHVPSNTAHGFIRALALAEKYAADYGFIDLFGGAMIHTSHGLFSLQSSIAQNLSVAPTGRTVRTLEGSLLVPELGASGEWAETTGSTIAAKPGGAAAGDDVSTGWLFVTPPVRVRLGAIATQQSQYDLGNDRLVVTERPFTIEAPVLSDHPTSIAIPVDYTQEF